MDLKVIHVRALMKTLYNKSTNALMLKLYFYTQLSLLPEDDRDRSKHVREI